MCEHAFVRWDNLTIDQDEQTRLPGYRDGAVVRHFDAPEALDTRFYEVRAKSALNRVPAASQVPFKWTINPYRGCSHACSYCLRGDTAILMADGTSRPLAALAPGDRILGTDGARQLVATDVVAHWSTVKASFRVSLADGRELVASADHRFLTDRGWRYVGPGQVDAALTTECSIVSIDGDALSREVAVAAIEPVGGEEPLYDITTGTGDFIANGVVSHNCFARPTHTYLDFDAGRDFEKEIVVKVNVPEVLRVELAKPSWKGEHVAMGTNTDPYQWVEGRYKLMRGIWAALRDAANPCSILTKSPLLLRDLDLMREVAAVTSVSANLSIPTLDEKAWRATEPHTPSPRARLEAVRKLNEAGIPCGVLIAPLMPGINDAPEQVDELLRLCAEAGAVGIGGIALHLRGEVKEVFFAFLEQHRPDLLPRYRQLYARGAYVAERERRHIEAAAGLPGDRLKPYPDRFKHRTGATRLGDVEDRDRRAPARQEVTQPSLF